jgi:RNA polymerase sigma-70 factor, ECF subfamily
MPGVRRDEAASRGDVTRLLLAWRHGDARALEELTPLVYAELRRIARQQMAGERRPDHTLQPTAVVNEAFLRLIDLKRIDWQDRAHFFAMSSRLMRRVLVDHARSRRYLKRGGGVPKTTLPSIDLRTDERPVDLIALDDALEMLAANDPRRSQVVELRYFGGLTVEETASVLQVSPDTVKRDWRLARAWLRRELQGDRSRDA